MCNSSFVVLDKFFFPGIKKYILCSNSFYCVFARKKQRQGSSSARVYNPVKEAIRNEKRKARRELNKMKVKHAIELSMERSKTRYIRSSYKALCGMAEKISRISSSHKRKDLLDQVCSPTKVKRDRVGTTVSKMFSVNVKTVRRKKTGRRLQKREIATRYLRVLTFLQDPQWSVTYPGKKDMVSCRYTRFTESGKSTVWRKKIPKVVLTENLSDLHVIYNRQNPDARVNLKFFTGVRKRSQFIKLLSHAKADVCLCQKHQNYALKLRAIKKYTKLTDIPDKLCRDFTADTFNKKLAELRKHIPNTVVYQEWKMTPIPVADPRVSLFLIGVPSCTLRFYIYKYFYRCPVMHVTF